MVEMAQNQNFSKYPDFTQFFPFFTPPASHSRTFGRLRGEGANRPRSCVVTPRPSIHSLSPKYVCRSNSNVFRIFHISQGIKNSYSYHFQYAIDCSHILQPLCFRSKDNLAGWEQHKFFTNRVSHNDAPPIKTIFMANYEKPNTQHVYKNIILRFKQAIFQIT